MQELPPYQREALAVVTDLKSDAAQGLAPEEARRRLERDGPNELQQAPPTPWWQHLLDQFKDTLVIILIVAAIISFAEWFLQTPREAALPLEAVVILIIVILNALLGFFQESRAERAVDALAAMSAPESTVIRGGQRQRLPARELVVGDIVLLEAGDQVPADARLIENANLRADEAPLTGESVPVRKQAEPLKEELGLGDQINMVFAGTTVSYGRGRAVVTATGMQTQVGNIAELIGSAVKEATPLQQELDRTGKILTSVMLVICGLVFATGVVVLGANDLSGVLQLFLFAVALAVAAIPEALPAIVTVGLSIGVQRMAANNAIVRKLPAVETLGSATVICSDKTGTLTRNEMTVQKMLVPAREPRSVFIDVSGSGYAPEGDFTIDGQPLTEQPPELQAAVAFTLRAAALANDAALIKNAEQWRIEGDPTEGALIVAAEKYGLSRDELQTDFPRVGEIPFTSELKRHTTVHLDREHPDQVLIMLKGAPDIVIDLCKTVRVCGEDQPLTDEQRAELLRQNGTLASEALRTLAMAYRVTPLSDFGVSPEAVTANFDQAAHTIAAAVNARTEELVAEELVFLGIVGMIDPPREEVFDAVATCYRAGIRPIMITGDHPQTAVAIAQDLGILRAGSRVMTGAELSRLDATELDQAVREVQVYARVNPEHKLRIVEALQQQGEIVAMTGDGVNDAPALKTANIGIAMGITGTDVSKEAADMVLTDDNFASIVKAIEEGRGIFDNIRKYLYFLLSSNAGEMLTIFLGVMLAGMLGLVNPSEGGFFLPLLAVQILWINLITDGPPALALGIDPKDPGVMELQPRTPGTAVITRRAWIMIFGVGMVMMVGTLFVLDSYYPGGLSELWVRETDRDAAERHARTMAFTTLMLFQLFNALNNRSMQRSAFFHLFENRWLWVALLFSVVAQVLVVYVPLLQRAFSTTPLLLADWLIATAIASSVLWVREIVKLVERRVHQPQQAIRPRTQVLQNPLDT